MRRTIANKRPSKRKALEPIFLSKQNWKLLESDDKISLSIPYFICRQILKRASEKSQFGRPYDIVVGC
jgi:hypothetical protein